MTLLIIALIFLVAATIVAVIGYSVFRQSVRERKNYERALKLVPLLIHLPPMSEDIESNGRDLRDIVDENTSKAQVIYNIIASTAQKGWKSQLYGQRHFSFEIIGSRGLVYFYAMVPVALVSVVKQAIISAYPTSQVEEVAEHNIFNPVGRSSGVTGGEFVLKKPFVFPIATYQEVKRDAMQTLLNSLSTLDKEDGVGIQILLRPAGSDWQKDSGVAAGHLRKGTKKKTALQQATTLVQQFFTALSKPPEDKKGDRPDLNTTDQSKVDAIEEKTRHPGYETLIRVVVSSNISSRAQAIMASITAAFSLFDAPGRNGFKFNSTHDVHRLTHDYILRLFPQQNKDMVLNTIELSTLFHFPDQRNIPTSQLQRQESKQVDAPRNMPNDGLLLGYNIFRGVKKAVRLDLSDRQRHMYVVGQTGTGKSTYLENLALQDMLAGNGFAFVDPHGDTAERLLAMVPKERTEDVIYFSPADMDYPMGLNLFEFNTPDEKDFLIQEALNMLYKLYDPQHSGIMGPRYEHLFRNAALTVMADPAGGSFVDIPKLFRDPKFVQQKLKFVTDMNVREFWEKEMPQSQRSNEFGDVVSWFVSKFGAFLSNEMMRNIIGQTKSAFNLREIMDNKKILLINLSKGRTGELNHKLLGMIFVMKFQAAAMSRANIKDENARKDFCLYVDEFQNFSTDSFATILSEARKYHLNLIVANQYTRQLSEEIRDAVFGNVGTVVGFRVGNDDDAEAIAKRMQPSFAPSDLLRVPNYNAAVRTMIDGVPTQPFSMATLPPLGSPNEQLAIALKQLSAAKYGRPRAQVEAEIFERMKTVEPPKPTFNNAPGNRPSWPSYPNDFGSSSSFPAAAPATASFGAPTAATPVPKAGNSSFLDEWLAKRQPKGTPAPNSVAAPAMPTQSAWPTAPPTMPTPIVSVPSTPASAAAPTEPDMHTIDLGPANATEAAMIPDRRPTTTENAPESESSQPGDVISPSSGRSAAPAVQGGPVISAPSDSLIQ